MQCFCNYSEVSAYVHLIYVNSNVCVWQIKNYLESAEDSVLSSTPWAHALEDMNSAVSFFSLLSKCFTSFKGWRLHPREMVLFKNISFSHDTVPKDKSSLFQQKDSLLQNWSRDIFSLDLFIHLTSTWWEFTLLTTIAHTWNTVNIAKLSGLTEGTVWGVLRYRNGSATCCVSTIFSGEILVVCDFLHVIFFSKNSPLYSSLEVWQFGCVF